MTTQEPETRSLAGRALLAVALTVTFYVLAIGIAVALIGGPILFYASGRSGSIWLAIAMVAAGLAILRAIIPERDRYEPPGPELTRGEQPRLHKLLDDVAERVGDRPADAVYLDLDLNASVLEHRRQRIMHLGLPVLATLEPDELQAVIAHEYGHYVGGDTRFSGWIWRTRAAVLKTVQRMAESESVFQRAIVRWPFQWYAMLFLRITNAVSRRAEFAADALAARATSPDAAGSALRRVEALAPAYDGFWSSDVLPMLAASRRPAIASGFAEMAAHSEVAPTLDDIVRSDIEQNEPNPYASHPTLRQRLEALGVATDGPAPAPATTPVTDLLEDVQELERRLLETRFGPEAGAFQRIEWTDAVDVHLERLRESVAEFGRALPEGLTIADAGATVRRLGAYRDNVRKLLPEESRDAPGEMIGGLLFDVLCNMVVVAAADAGAEITAVPGEPIRIHRAGEVLDPWKQLGEVAAATGESEHQWTNHPVVRALADTPLARPRAEAGVAS